MDFEIRKLSCKASVYVRSLISRQWRILTFCKGHLVNLVVQCSQKIHSNIHNRTYGHLSFESVSRTENKDMPKVY